MDRFKREWSQDPGGWWRPSVNEERGPRAQAGLSYKDDYFQVKLTYEGNQRLLRQGIGNPELDLLDFFQEVTCIETKGFDSAMREFMEILETAHDPVPTLAVLDILCTDLSFIRPILDAIKSKSLPKLRELGMMHVSLNNDEEGEVLAGAIASGDLLYLKVLNIVAVKLRSGHFTLAKAMESGKMPTLEYLHLTNTSMGEEACEAYATAMSSGSLPSLLVLDFERNRIGNKGATVLGHAIRTGQLKELVRLFLDGNMITDEGLIALVDSFQVGATSVLSNLRVLNLSDNKFTEQSLQRLAKALELGYLNSLDVLSLPNNNPYSEETAKAFISALAKNKYLALHMSSYLFDTALNHRREQLLKRNARNKALLAGTGGAAIVSAAASKVYLCGHPEAGKTTFCLTLHTIQLSRLEALTKRRSHVEGRTRGIEVSPILSKGDKSGENPTSLLVWDMAGQEDYHLLHNAFFRDADSTEGKATTFVIVCSLKSVDDNLEESKKQLFYWLRFISSSCSENSQNLGHVLVVLNNFIRNLNVAAIQNYWQHVLEDQRKKFASRLDIQTNSFVGDVREASLVRDINNCLLEHSRNSLRDEKVPKICQFIQENLSIWSEPRQEFPVLHWEEFMALVRKSSSKGASELWSEETIEMYWKGELWPEQTLEAATKYLHEAGALIFIDRDFPSHWDIPDRKLVVLSPNWFCSQVVGNVYLHPDMGFPAKHLFRKKMNKEIALFRMKVDKRTGSISEEAFKKFFKSSMKLAIEWSETELEDLLSILLWFGFCYKGRNQDVFIPSLIDEIGIPVDPWGPFDSQEVGTDQWVMGFSVEHHKNELTIAPIALWHTFQVELAQTPRYNDRPDNDFVCGRYSVTFSIDFMKVLITVNVNKGSPTLYDINILVKPLPHVHDSDGTWRKQLQVDLASELVDVLQRLWEQVCPGVEYLQRVVWPWPASWSGLHVISERNLDVQEAKELVRRHGLGWTMQWEVGITGAITVDQLLSTKDKDEVMQDYLLLVREGVAEAVELRIFPHAMLGGGASSKESTLPSNETEETPPISPLSKLVLNKLNKIDKKLDQNDDKLNKRLDNMEILIRDGFSKQRQLLQKVHNTGHFFRQDRERTCPRFIYLGERNSGTWVTLKDALSPSVSFRLQFACEAQFNDYKLHKVSNQQGIDVSELKGWVGKIAPWLKVSLTVLLICAKIGGNIVVPGLGLILPDFGQAADGVSSISEGLLWATGFTKDELDEHMMQDLGLDASRENWDPRELYGKSREAISKLLEQKLSPKAYEEKLRLRKVCLNHLEGSNEEIAWICLECYEKYKMSSISIREL